jgi:hypothetical protein
MPAPYGIGSYTGWTLNGKVALMTKTDVRQSAWMLTVLSGNSFFRAITKMAQSLLKASTSRDRLIQYCLRAEFY